jgi:hypothetical protein
MGAVFINLSPESQPAITSNRLNICYKEKLRPGCGGKQKEFQKRTPSIMK